MKVTFHEIIRQTLTEDLHLVDYERVIYTSWEKKNTEIRQKNLICLGSYFLTIFWCSESSDIACPSLIVALGLYIKPICQVIDPQSIFEGFVNECNGYGSYLSPRAHFLSLINRIETKDLFFAKNKKGTLYMHL